MRGREATRVLALGAALVLMASCHNAPPLRIHIENGAANVDVQTLGEYPTSVARVRLRDARSGGTLWEIVHDGRIPQFRGFRLRAGDNAAALEDVEHGAYRVVAPSGGRAFGLLAGAEYTIEVWGSDEPGSVARASFVLPARDRGALVPEDSDGNTVLYVGNQSYTRSPVDITVFLDDRPILSSEFSVGDQHDYVEYEFRFPEGRPVLKPVSDTGGAEIEREIDIASKHRGFVGYRYDPSGEEGPGSTLPIQRETISFR